MKKIGLVIVISACFLASCGMKNNKTTGSDSGSSTSEAQKISDSSSSTTAESMQMTVTTTPETTTSTTAKETIPTVATTVTSSATVAPSEQETSLDPLSGYTNDQIEFARVWLAVMGSHYKTDLARGEFELHVRRSAAGAPVNPYDENSLTYPNETIVLSGKYGYQSIVVYSSNHNGSITCYPSPSHFQAYQGDQEALRSQEQEILNKASVVSIPTGNPEDIKELIAVMAIDN